MRNPECGFEDAFSRSSLVDWCPFPAFSFSLVIFGSISVSFLIPTSRSHPRPTIPKIRIPHSAMGSRQWQCQQDGGIEVNSMPPDSDVQVRRGGSAGPAAQPDDLSLLHAVAFAHIDFRQVHVKRR